MLEVGVRHSLAEVTLTAKRKPFWRKLIAEKSRKEKDKESEKNIMIYSNKQCLTLDSYSN